MAYPEFSTKCSETQQRFLHYGLKICQMQNQNHLIVKKKRLKSTYPATYCWALGLVMNSNSERTGVPIIYDKDHKNQTIMLMILVKYAMGTPPGSWRSGQGSVCPGTSACCWSSHPGCIPHSKHLNCVCKILNRHPWHCENSLCRFLTSFMELCQYF